MALKGSDGESIRDQALAMGARQRAVERTHRAFSVLSEAGLAVKIYCWDGAMGADALQGLDLDHEVCGHSEVQLSEPSDTRAAAQVLAKLDIDVLVFAGGDGTARDVLDALEQASTPQRACLGIPCGVKMHSSVYAVSPEAGGELLQRLARAGLVNVERREVRDIDEDAFRAGSVKARYYGELLTPEEGHFLQHTKVSGVENAELVAQDIAAYVVETMSEDTLYLLGPGSTTAAITDNLDLPGTLLGVDAVCAGKLMLADANAPQLLDLAERHAGPTKIVLTAIGGQGHVFGRGNQQFSPELIRVVGLDNIQIVAAKGKITALEGRPLLVDTNDPVLDAALSGYRTVLTGYQDSILYPVAALP